MTGRGPILIEVPRDRDSSFERFLIRKHKHHFTGFDEPIMAMHARGMRVRGMRRFLAERYGTEVCPDFRQSVDAIMIPISRQT
ncbi:transposase [Burkholderia seminalis]|nr:transposase [Burkholderia seminalis]MCA8305196.1 transposase [Burkholderia seminalis]